MVKTGISPHKSSPRKLILRVVALVFLVAGSSFLFYSYSNLFLRVGGKVTQFVSEMFIGPADIISAEPVLRGTVYDRTFKEMAVSYRLFSLYSHPREIDKKEGAVGKLSEVLDEPEEAIAAYLKNSFGVVELADDLDEEQVESITNANLSGIYCKEKEVRFYPSHATASHILGFVDHGVGLAGIEGSFDTVLQPGEFKRESAPIIDFKEHEVLGKGAADLILTLDLELQKQFKQELQKYLLENDIKRGLGFVIEPFSGNVLAAVSNPSFDPNYFWQVNEQKRKDLLYRHLFSQQLVKKVIAKAAAVSREGLSASLLPPTVAAPYYGISDEVFTSFEEQIKLKYPVSNNVQLLPYNEERTAGEERLSEEGQDSLTGAQIGVALASLVNGGWRIAPNFITGLFDHHTQQRFVRDNDRVEKQHVLDPAFGVVVRRELLKKYRYKSKNKNEQFVDFTSSYDVLKNKSGFSEHIMQELYMGFAPAGRPKYLIVIAIERDNIFPSLKGKKRSLRTVGHNVLKKVLSLTEQIGGKYPETKSEENYQRFLIGKRLDYKEAVEVVAENEIVMPEVKGLSLRKGLQQLNLHQVAIRVNGTGIIVAQTPSPGEPLQDIDECVLTLESEI